MKSRTKIYLFINLALCLVILSCQFSPFDFFDGFRKGEPDANQSSASDEQGNFFNTKMPDWLSGIFHKNTDEKKSEKTNDENDHSGFGSAGFSLVGQLGGSSMAVAVTGDLAVMGQGPRVVTLDVSDPKNPTLLGESDVLSGLVRGIEVIGEYAYVTTDYGGLNILDISNPSKPEFVSSVEPEFPGCSGINIEDNIAYIGCNSVGLFIVDVSDPKTPEILFQEATPGKAAVSIAHVGNYIYATTLSSGLDIINVENPKMPVYESKFDNSEVPGAEENPPVYMTVKTCGEYLCLGGFGYAFFLLDLSDPVKPTVLDWIPMYADGMAVNGNTAYLSGEIAGKSGIYKIDISDPENLSEINLIPEEIGNWELWGYDIGERGLFLQNGLLFITDEVYGLTIADVGNPESPARVGFYMTPLPYTLFDIQLKDDYAFLTANIAGFRTVDISDPSHPRELAYDDERKYISSQGPSGLKIRDNYAYISDMSSDYPLRIYDVSNPANLRQTGFIEGNASGGGTFDIVLNGNLAYLSSQGIVEDDNNYPLPGILVVDIEDPNNPVEVNFVEMNNKVWGLSITNNYLFALDVFDVDINDPKRQPRPIFLHVFDLSNPQEPGEVNTITIAESPQISNNYKMLVDEDRLYIATSPVGVLVFDISEPAKPELLTTIPIMTNAQGMYKDQQYLFADGMNVYDITNLDKPDVVGIYFMDLRDIAVKEELVFIAVPFQGMYVLQFDPVNMGQYVLPELPAWMN